jgi:hypothetical protein
MLPQFIRCGRRAEDLAEALVLQGAGAQVQPGGRGVRGASSGPGWRVGPSLAGLGSCAGDTWPVQPVKLLMQERGERQGGTGHQQAGADRQRVAQAAAELLIDGDEVGEKPAPQVVLFQDGAQRRRARVLMVSAMSGADIHLGVLAGDRRIDNLSPACLAPEQMRQVPGIPRSAGQPQLGLVLAAEQLPVVIERMQQYPARDQLDLAA